MQMQQFFRPPLVEVHTADIHFGVMDAKKQYDILKEQMINVLAPVKFDAFFINGDLFDHKFYLNSDVTYYVLRFIDDVVQLCMKNNATLVVLHGTYSHDAKQFQLFSRYSQCVDIRIVEHIDFQYIKGTTVLCIPEEYNKDPAYYMNKLLERDYDMVVLHGAIKGAIYGMDKVDFNGKTPVFGLESFRRCYGPIICGHVHVAKCFENHIYYCGSPIRWKFGEEQAKGFLICTYNPNTYQYYMHFQVIESFRYDTINLTNMLAFEPIVVIEHIKKLKEKGIDYIKIKFDTACPTTDLIKKHFSTSRDIKIDVADAKFAETIQRNQENVDDMDKYAYMLNPNAKPEEIFVQYVNQCMGECYITVEELTKILNEGI